MFVRSILLVFFLIFSNIALFPLNDNLKQDRSIEIEWSENAEIINHPVYGVIVLSKDRWKNWVFRSSIIIMLYISVMIIILAIPKNSDFNFIIAYILLGSLFVISFWETLSGWMLTRLRSYAFGWSFIAVSIPMYIASYFALMKVKKNDISYAQLKEEIKKIQDEANKTYEDPRLFGISGLCGEWEDDDFVRHK